MKNKILITALGVPQGFPWRRDLSEIDEKNIIEILREADIDSEDKRRLAGWKICNVIYREILNSKDNIELVEKVLLQLKDESYITKEVVESFIRRKRFANKEEIEIFKNVIKNKSTITEKKKNSKNITLWLVELVSFNMIIENPQLKLDEIKEELLKIVAKYFNEIKIDEKDIKDVQYRLGLLRKNNINLISKNFNKGENIYRDLLKEFQTNEEIKEEKEENGDDFLADSLFNILNDVEELEIHKEIKKDKETNYNQMKNKEVKKEKFKKEFINKEKITKEIKEKEKLRNINSEKGKSLEKLDEVSENHKNKEIEKNLNALAKSLGYKIVKDTEEEIQEEYKEIEILKELASLKKAAVLSELYNAYINIDKISKDNLEAVISNFFTTLKLQGFEVDDKNEVGEEVTVDTKNLLSEFLFSSAIDTRGTVNGTIEYLGWNYKGKMVVPMIIKPKK